MLSRSSISIRKLIPHRRLSDEDLNGAELKIEDALLDSWTEKDASSAGSGGKIYTTTRHTRKKRAPAPIIATSPLTHSDILRPLPPLPSETPRSSASSSCKCEVHDECDCPLLSWKRRSPVYSTASKGESEEHLLLSLINTSGPDDTLTRHIPKSRFYLSNDSKSKGDVTRPLSSEEGDKETSTKGRQSEETISPDLSDDAQQFMQEAENAFKPIGSTLSAVNELAPPTPPPKEAPSKSPLAKARSSFESSPDTPPKDSTPPQKPTMRKSRKPKQLRAMRPMRKSTTPKQATRSGPRWTLTENVSELLTGKLFHRIEADEMLTPDQIEAFKQQRITKLQVDKMAEALEQEFADPIEPLDLDESPSRVESTDVNLDIEALIEEKLASFPEYVGQRNFMLERQRRDNTSSPLGQRPTFHTSKTSPIMSTRHVRSSSRKLMTELPIIPETSPLPRSSDELYSSNESNDSLGISLASEYVYLKSPSYSLTTPTIRHGAIRLSKSDLLPDMKLGGDDGLDWTAFQMAILGGAGDLFSESDDTIRRGEAEEIADITEWWESWHFESTGTLATSDCEASSPTSTISGDEIPDFPHSPQTQRESRASNLQLDLGFTKGKKNSQSHYNVEDTWQEDSEQKEVLNHESVNSLPPSPMLDLRVIRSSDGDDMDVVPMGYNLGHDLGDFLKWEAEHAYAGDFSSLPGLS
ncbi:hypothetical protein O1611_g3983 [Lasiodiplodia mahajangana]|uniref:Uncharacterized protein n=1 Tax=Lasiodiplodia mahajangana TaxID=1108764 RepID=A0ACC2JQ65_9PEZI|nr:hypothetical protein O1611_g3983 [Lasiodiplodia mahajangana]